MKPQKFLYGIHSKFTNPNSAPTIIQRVLRSLEIQVYHSELDSESSIISFPNIKKYEVIKMLRILVISLLVVAEFGLTFCQTKYQTREEKLQQLKTREDIKGTEVKKDLLKLEYRNGKVMYKNIGDYELENNSLQKVNYSPTYDSTIIDLTTIDTTLYYQKYSYWQEVPVHNWEFDHIRIGDVNKNGRQELYGARKFFSTPQEPIAVYELNNAEKFVFVHQYDSGTVARNVYDFDKDGEQEFHLSGNYSRASVLTFYQSFFKKLNDSSLATDLGFIFEPYQYQSQLNDLVLDDLDGDQFTDLLFVRAGEPDLHIFEYNPAINNFDSIYRFDVNETPPWANSGFSISDFDLDGKKDMVFGTGKGAVYVLENQVDNQYTNSWIGSVQSYHAYIHTWTNDIDGNGKPEFWVLADAYYSGSGTTRITIFETNGNNNYQAVGRVDLVGVFSFYAGTMQAVDIDHDGIEEVAICIDGNFLILKFNGEQNIHTYELYYIKQNELSASGQNSVYFGATVYDLMHNGEVNFLISMDHIIELGGNPTAMRFTQIYRPDTVTSITSSSNIIPESDELFQNYPNPFNPTTNITFSIAHSTNVSIKIYNVLGKEIKTLLDEYISFGRHTIKWDGTDERGNLLPGGVYFIKMVADSYHKIIKTILLK